MIQTINCHDFIDAFQRAGRIGQFSYEGLNALFKYFEEANPDMELDVVAICRDYSEDTVEAIAEAYGLDLPESETEDEHADAVKSYLESHTTVVAKTATGFVYAQF